MSSVRRLAGKVRRSLLDRGIQLERLSREDRWYLTALVDDRQPLPPSAKVLRGDAPRLQELRSAYATADPVVRVHSQWTDDELDRWLDLEYFRGDNHYVWHYREGRRVSELKYLVYLQDIVHRDEHGLLDRLTEDGAFGCWTYEYDGLPRCSRDLLDSVNELLYLHDRLGVLDGTTPRVLDIGAGYGRMAHRYATAVPTTTDYCCVDAIAESTFLCEYYLEHREIAPPARAVTLVDVPSLEPGSFDLAINIHSWSECTLAAIDWWVGHLRRLEVPRIFVVPNEESGFLSRETDGSRRDFLPTLERAGYRLVNEEPAHASPAVRHAMNVRDRHCLFEMQA